MEEALTVADPIPTFGEPEPGVTYTLRPGAYVVLRDVRGRVAVVRAPGGVYLPGGGLLEGESHEEAAVRECREECALEVRLGASLGTADDLVWSHDDRTHYRKRCSYYVGDVVGPILGIAAEHELAWLAPDEARSVLTHGSQRWALSKSGPPARHGDGGA